MAQEAKGDPRRVLASGDLRDVRPVVARASIAPTGLAIGIVIAIFAVALFFVLEGRRRSLEAPAVRTAVADRAGISSREPPPLYLPPPPAPPPVAVPASIVPTPTPFVLPRPPSGPPRVVYLPQPPQPQPPMPLPPMAQPRTTSGPALVIDQSGPQGGNSPADGAGGTGEAGTASGAGARATTTVLANKATTVAQGTLIPAVLETGFDSTKSGLARAIVSSDVRGFDGSRVLIPRGSRVIGEYSGGAEPGQHRVVINWTRLVRPDGVTVAIGSHATDSVGRGGVRASVNSHFLARLIPAILQSALDVGVNLASRQASGSVVVALPSVGQTGTGLLGNQTQPAPTLTVPPGTSIAILVARDLDFTGVGNPQ